ncbi:MAG: thymidylate synthase [Clostridiales bacterium]|nr:thymidylate synthase [Clostridiales bacterium]
MSKADYTLLNNYISILKDGEWDIDQNVRPRWTDGTPAHTVKKFGVVNRYNLQEEFPISGVRKTNWKAAIDEIIWIWVLKSNNVKYLNSKIWDQWANKGEKQNQEIGSIGKAYGYQLGEKVIVQKDGSKIDQVDYVLNELKNNPANRRILTEIYKHSDLHEMNLAPCVHEATFNVVNGTLNMVLNQRSNDTLAAGSWNVMQYAALLSMLAQASGLKAGEMVHVVTDSHVYDKHVPMELEIIFNRCSLIQKRLMSKVWEEHNKLPLPMTDFHVKSTIARALNLDMRDTNTIDQVSDMIRMFESSNINFENEIAHAKAIQSAKELKGTDYKNYLDEVKRTDTFKSAENLIQIMIKNSKIDKALDFSTPKLILDPNVKNFYDFKSPKMRTGTSLTVENGQLVREGKFVDNPESSFDVLHYYPELEGKELDTRVPVAE